ncbi:MAG: Hsp20 family protein [Clostridiales bacterium]|nr:Hsp20 family protein [Clostridiales bacterium]
MFPFYKNNASKVRKTNKSINNNFENSYDKKNFSQQDINNIINSITGSFTTVFESLVQNEDLINNIIDNVLNSDAVNSLINAIEEKSYFKLREYDDSYLIEGKLFGVDKKDIDIDYEDNHIKISVKKNLNLSNKNDNMIMWFYQEGNVLEETYYVPNIDEKSIRAVYTSNILIIYLKKKRDIITDGEIIDVDDFTEINN